MLLNYHIGCSFFLDCCVLELGCGSAGVVSGLPAEPHCCPVGIQHINDRNMLSI